MPNCAAFGCHNFSGDPGNVAKKLSFHKFPRHELLRLAWVRAVRRANFKPIDTSVLCSRHFEEKCFKRSCVKKRRQLQETAIPTIFTSHSFDCKTLCQLDPADAVLCHKNSIFELQKAAMKEMWKKSNKTAQKVEEPIDLSPSAPLTLDSRAVQENSALNAVLQKAGVRSSDSVILLKPSSSSLESHPKASDRKEQQKLRTFPKNSLDVSEMEQVNKILRKAGASSTDTVILVRSDDEPPSDSQDYGVFMRLKNCRQKFAELEEVLESLHSTHEEFLSKIQKLEAMSNVLHGLAVENGLIMSIKSCSATNPFLTVGKKAS